MKRILKIIGLFIFLAFVGMYSYSTGTTSGKFVEHADHGVISQSGALQTSVDGALPLFYNTDAVEGMAIAYPDTLPLPLDHLSSNAQALSGLSNHLTSVEQHFQRYFSSDFILKILLKKILFPFHSFW